MKDIEKQILKGLPDFHHSMQMEELYVRFLDMDYFTIKDI